MEQQAIEVTGHDKNCAGPIPFIRKLALVLPLCFLTLACKQEVTGAFGWTLGGTFEPGKYQDKLSETNGVQSITYYELQEPGIAPFESVTVKATAKDHRIVSIIADMPRQPDFESSKAALLGKLQDQYGLIEKTTNSPYVETYEFGGKDKVVTAIVFDDGNVRLHYRIKSRSTAVVFHKQTPKEQLDTREQQEVEKALSRQ